MLSTPRQFSWYAWFSGCVIFCAPSEEQENDLPKWWWELWRFLLALEFDEMREQDSRVLLFAGRVIDTVTMRNVDGLPEWLGLPAMMRGFASGRCHKARRYFV